VCLNEVYHSPSRLGRKSADIEKRKMLLLNFEL
jgi:hypothetical protein